MIVMSAAYAGSSVWFRAVGCPSWSPQMSTSITHPEGDQPSFVPAGLQNNLSSSVWL